MTQPAVDELKRLRAPIEVTSLESNWTMIRDVPLHHDLTNNLPIRDNYLRGGAYQVY